MSNLVDFYKEKRYNVWEGHSQNVKEQSSFLRNIVNNPSINNVMEIGFNAGHSAELFLSSNKNINMVSFDINEHDCVKMGKEYIDRNYPNRHELIIGNSCQTVPEYFKKETKKFDVIFIDGSHFYPIVKKDIINCKNLAHDKTIVILDDTVKEKKWIRSWNNGPNHAWNQAKNNNIIKEIGSTDFEGGRGQSWGHYIL